MSWLRIGAAIAARPALWRTAVRQVRRTAAPQWYRHAPFLPVPAADYMHFRLVTQYGDANHRPVPADVVNYLAWCKQWDSQSR